MGRNVYLKIFLIPQGFKSKIECVYLIVCSSFSTLSSVNGYSMLQKPWTTWEGLQLHFAHSVSGRTKECHTKLLPVSFINSFNTLSIFSSLHVCILWEAKAPLGKQAG